MELIQQIGTLINQVQFEIKNTDLKQQQIEDLEQQIANLKLTHET